MQRLLNTQSPPPLLLRVPLLLRIPLVLRFPRLLRSLPLLRTPPRPRVLPSSRTPPRGWCLLFTAGCAAPLSATPNDIPAGPVSDVSVTVYRAPHSTPDSLDLNQLGGFALVSETRTVSLPAGESRIRFGGVADGIDAASAIITGLPTGVLEKNRDARLLSPSALVAATVGRNALLVRTDPKTGKTTEVDGTVRSDADGVLFQSSAGVEALRCSGLSETFDFESTVDAAATPTLSALVRSPRPTTAKIRLSYLARGFDWMANYVATVSPDGKTMDLGAWVTLANSNSVSFSGAHAQVVAGRLNRESGNVEPVDRGGEILAQCWPRGSTSDTPEVPFIERATPLLQGPSYIVLTAMGGVAMAVAMPAPAFSFGRLMKEVMVKEEQLGDLKLYRVPERTSVTSQQIKQVRLLDRHAVPIDLLYSATLPVNASSATAPLRRLVRTQNDRAHQLGLPLPSGRLDVFLTRGDARLLLSESPLRDMAVDEQVEIDLGAAPDVEVTSVVDYLDVDVGTIKELPLIPGVVDVRTALVKSVNRIEVTNAHDSPVSVELRMQLPADERLVKSDHIPITRAGRPVFTLTVPAHATATVRYRTEHISFRAVNP
jgi:hypothetical protein